MISYCCRINLLLGAKVVFKLCLEGRIALEVVRAYHRAKGEALLVHAVSEGPTEKLGKASESCAALAR